MALRERLIEICEETIRPLAAENDKTSPSRARASRRSRRTASSA